MNEVALGSLCSRVASGGTPSRKESSYFGGGIPWVKTMDLDDGPVVKTDETISTSGLLNSSAKIFPRGTVLVAMYGATVGKLGYLLDEAACNQAACALVPDTKTCDPRWLYYLLLSRRGDLVGLASGAAQQNLNVGLIRNFSVRAPSLEVQRAIGEVLGALDDKITANRRVVMTCDELRSQLWKRACATDSNEVPLSSLARFVNGRAFTKGASGTGRVVIRIAELNSGIGASTVRNDIEVADDHVARPGDLLLAWSGSLTSARWFRDEAIVNQHIFKVVPDDGSDIWAVASAVESKMADFREIAKDKATTMGHIRRSDLDQPVRWPSVSTEISVLGRNLWSRALSAEKENEVLARTRDELLPLLMNGRITVKDAECAAEDVL